MDLLQVFSIEDNAGWYHQGRGISAEGLPPSDWLWASPWSIFLMNDGCKEGQLTGVTHPWAVSLGSKRKQTKQAYRSMVSSVVSAPGSA